MGIRAFFEQLMIAKVGDQGSFNANLNKFLEEGYRRVISGIVHVLKCGCRWCDCPEAYGPPTTIYNRFVRWARRGIWENLFRELAGSGRSADTQMIDSTHVKRTARQRAEKGGAEAGCWPLARRAQHEDSRTRRC